MSEPANWPNKKGLNKIIKYGNRGYDIYLGTGWDLSHGKGWFCQVHRMKYCKYLKKLADDCDYSIGFGFHKANKFSAVRQAIQYAKTYD